MENNQNNSGLKAAVVVLAILLLSSIAYIYKTTTDNTETVRNLTVDKDTIETDLKAKIAEYDALIAEDNALKADFQVQKEEMQVLLANLEKAKGDANAMAKYKNEYFRLKREMENLVAENQLLKQQNVKLTSNLDSTNVVLTSIRVEKDTLEAQKASLSKTVEKASKLSVVNLNVTAVKEKSSGKQTETDKASRANKLNISFIIAENEVAKSGDRTYYVQIIDAKNNILGEKETIPMGGDLTLTYSFATTVTFQNKTVKVNESITGKDFQAGSYFVNVFNANGENVSKTSFSLR